MPAFFQKTAMPSEKKVERFKLVFCLPVCKSKNWEKLPIYILLALQRDKGYNNIVVNRFY